MGYDTSVISCTPSDVNGFLSVVFIGPEKFDAKQFGSLFRICKQKIWDFLIWLCHHNAMYANIPLNPAIMSLYPDDGPIPGLDAHVVKDQELNADCVFHLETAGFSKHPSILIAGSSQETIANNLFMVEKMGLSDPESNRLTGRSFVASAIRNLLPKDRNESHPDLVIHHNGQPVTEYNNPTYFLGLFPILFPYGIGGCAVKTWPTALAFKKQAKYLLSVCDCAFRHHNRFIFVLVNILQCR